MSKAIVGIGCDKAQALSAEVLMHSIARSTHLPLAVVKLHDVPEWAEMSGELKGRQRTAFSFQRFLLARKVIEDSADVGIYLDSDMLVLRPIEQLVEEFVRANVPVATVAPCEEWRRRRQSSVLVMNREGADQLWNTYRAYLSDQLSYDDLMYLRRIPEVGTLSYRWNCLEYLDETTALIHYTDVDAQPWLRAGNPNAGVWMTYLWRYTRSAEGEATLLREIQCGHVRPSLSDVVRLGPSESQPSTYGKWRDLRFVPPHRVKRVPWPWARVALAPVLRGVIALRFLLKNGQLNIR